MDAKKTLVVLLAGIVFFMFAGSVSAGKTDDPGLQKMISDQQKRIDTGLASGQLTRDEAAVLQDNLNWVKTEEARMKADGRLTPKERRRLHRILDNNSGMIYKKKHNPVRRLY